MHREISAIMNRIAPQAGRIATDKPLNASPQALVLLSVRDVSGHSVRGGRRPVVVRHSRQTRIGPDAAGHSRISGLRGRGDSESFPGENLAAGRLEAVALLAISSTIS